MKWFSNSIFTHLLAEHTEQANNRQVINNQNNIPCPEDHITQKGSGSGSDVGWFSKNKKGLCEPKFFQMPVNYPRYTKADYENMEEWRVDRLLDEYGLDHIKGTLDEKRKFAIGTFLWPDQF